MKVERFFATRSDLLAGAKALEAGLTLRYLRDTNYLDKNIQAFRSLAAIPDLGFVVNRSPRFVVIANDDAVRPTRIIEVAPGSRWRRRKWRALAFVASRLGIRLPGLRRTFEIEHAKHPSSILFSPGGFHDDTTLVAGELSTLLSGTRSVTLFHLFQKHLLDGFVRHRAFSLGPEALDLLQRGNRLTVDANASRDLDVNL